MDTLSEQFVNGSIQESVQINENFKIGCLEWVDDVMTCTTGKKNEQKILDKVDDFAKAKK